MITDLRLDGDLQSRIVLARAGCNRLRESTVVRGATLTSVESKLDLWPKSRNQVTMSRHTTTDD